MCDGWGIQPGVVRVPVRNRGGVLVQPDPVDMTKVASDDELLDRIGCGWLPVTEQDELIRVLVAWRDHC